MGIDVFPLKKRLDWQLRAVLSQITRDAWEKPKTVTVGWVHKTTAEIAFFSDISPPIFVGKQAIKKVNVSYLI